VQKSAIILNPEMVRNDEKDTLDSALSCALAIGVLILRPFWRLAKQTAHEARARESVRSINNAEQQFARLNPSQGFTCDLDDLRRAGWVPPSSSPYAYEIGCDGLERPRTSYLIFAYPADKLPQGVWGFWVMCSDQSGKVWQNLSREEMQDTATEDERAGKYDLAKICRRDNEATLK